MTDTMQDYAYAARFRDVVRTIADGEIDSLRPKYTYGKILDIDVVGRKALVVDNGDVDDNAVWRPYGAIAPRAIGQFVRIEGLSGDRFIADIMGEGNLTDPDTIPPPANLALSTTVDYTLPQVTVTWQAPTTSDPFGYQVRWRPASSTNWQYRFVQAPTVTTMLYPLAKDTIYNVEVATIGRSGGISAATAGTITTGHDTTAPNAPTGLTVVAGFEVLEISWNDNAEPDVKFGAGTYRVQVATDSGFTAIIRDFVVGATKTTVVNLADSTTYYVRIYARDADGNQSLPSASVSVTTNAPVVPVLTDGAPPSTSPTPTVTGGYGFLAVLWTAITNHDPVMYEVHMSTVSGFTPDRTGATTKYGEVSGTGMIVKKLPDGTALAFGTTYYFKIIAKDADGKGPDSAQGSGTMQQITSGDQVIANAAITNAMIQNITADKIQSGTMTAQTFTVGSGGSIQSSGFVTGAGGAGWKITDTTAEFHGTVYATSGSFSGDLQVSTIRGWLTLDVAGGGGLRTASSGNRIEIGGSSSNGNRVINFFSGVAPEFANGYLMITAQHSSLDNSDWGEINLWTPVMYNAGFPSGTVAARLIMKSQAVIGGTGGTTKSTSNVATAYLWGNLAGMKCATNTFNELRVDDGTLVNGIWGGIETQMQILFHNTGQSMSLDRFWQTNPCFNLLDGSNVKKFSVDLTNGVTTMIGDHLDRLGRTTRDADGGWVRTYGNTGWYNNDYAGGWYMIDATYVRSYNSKPVVAGANTRLGDTGTWNAYASIMHQSLSGNNYALIQDNGANTLLNSGSVLYLRYLNNDRMAITSAAVEVRGVYFTLNGNIMYNQGNADGNHFIQGGGGNALWQGYNSISLRTTQFGVQEQIGAGSGVVRTVNFAASGYMEHDASTHSNLSDTRFKNILSPPAVASPRGKHRALLGQLGRPFQFSWKPGFGGDSSLVRYGYDADMLPAEFIKRTTLSGGLMATMVDPQSMISWIIGVLCDLADDHDDLRSQVNGRLNALENRPVKEAA